MIKACTAPSIFHTWKLIVRFMDIRNDVLYYYVGCQDDPMHEIPQLKRSLTRLKTCKKKPQIFLLRQKEMCQIIMIIGNRLVLLICLKLKTAQNKTAQYVIQTSHFLKIFKPCSFVPYAFASFLRVCFVIITFVYNYLSILFVQETMSDAFYLDITA